MLALVAVIFTFLITFCAGDILKEINEKQWNIVFSNKTIQDFTYLYNQTGLSHKEAYYLTVAPYTFTVIDGKKDNEIDVQYFDRNERCIANWTSLTTKKSAQDFFGFMSEAIYEIKDSLLWIWVYARGIQIYNSRVFVHKYNVTGQKMIEIFYHVIKKFTVARVRVAHNKVLEKLEKSLWILNNKDLQFLRAHNQLRTSDEKQYYIASQQQGLIIMRNRSEGYEDWISVKLLNGQCETLVEWNAALNEWRNVKYFFDLDAKMQIKTDNDFLHLKFKINDVEHKYSYSVVEGGSKLIEKLTFSNNPKAATRFRYAENVLYYKLFDVEYKLITILNDIKMEKLRQQYVKQGLLLSEVRKFTTMFHTFEISRINQTDYNATFWNLDYFQLYNEISMQWQGPLNQWLDMNIIIDSPLVPDFYRTDGQVFMEMLDEKFCITVKATFKRKGQPIPLTFRYEFSKFNNSIDELHENFIFTSQDNEIVNVAVVVPEVTDDKKNEIQLSNSFKANNLEIISKKQSQLSIYDNEPIESIDAPKEEYSQSFASENTSGAHSTMILGYKLAFSGIAVFYMLSQYILFH